MSEAMNQEHEARGYHQQCWELLPWHVNGTLKGAERALMEAHLGDCLICRREFEYLRKLGPVLHAADESDDAIERGLSRTLASIEAAQQASRTRRKWAEAFASGLRQLASAFRHSPPATKLTMAGQFVLIAVLGGLWLAPPDYTTRPAYETLSAAGLQSMPERARLGVVFREGTQERAVRDLLMKLGARIVDGPSPAGRYTVELPIPPAAVGPGSAVLARLKSDPVVLLAEGLRTM